MAKRRIVTLVDDVDQTTADETVPFGLDNVEYSIDLSSSNAARLRGALQPWIGAGRRTGGRRRRSG